MIKLFKLILNSELKAENKKLKKIINDMKKEQKPLIDLKNIYLSMLRCKNLENGKLKKKIEKLELENEELKQKMNYDIIN